jgi:glycosyltransferase involved in cell wall biosynthesis
MIVKDEAVFLPRCLESIKDVADQIIIVDTGSTDRTVDIAKEYTQHVYLHPWEDNFARHRNQSLGYATGDWILVIDADEELLADRSQVRHELNDLTTDAIAVRIINKNSGSEKDTSFDSTRFFRNHQDFHYQGIVHEQLVGPNNLKLSDIRIMHHGYGLGEQVALKKHQRTSVMLKQQLDHDPENLFALINLSISCLSVGNHEDALNHATMAIHIIEREDISSCLFRHAYIVAYRILLLMNQVLQAEDICQKSLERYGSDPEILSGLIIINIRQNRWEHAIKYGNGYLKSRTRPSQLERIRYGSSLVAVFNEWMVLAWIGTALAMTGNENKACELFEQAIVAAPAESGFPVQIAQMLFASGNSKLAMKYISRSFPPKKS